MSERADDFKKKGAQSALYEELSDTKQQNVELKRRNQMLYVYALKLFYQNRSKDQKIDDLYCRMYGLAEIPKKKKDRKKICRTLQRMENRPQNTQDIAFPSTELWSIFHTDMLPAGKGSRSRARCRDGRRYNDPLPPILPDHLGWGVDHDGYE